VSSLTSIGTRISRSRFLRFALVGGAGFLVNEAALWAALTLLGVGKYTGGVIGFLAAVTFTWWGNRTLTFPDRAANGLQALFLEWLRFVGANGVGFAVNYGLYAALVTFAPAPADNPYIALACGTVAGLVFNFILSSRLVYRA